MVILLVVLSVADRNIFSAPFSPYLFEVQFVPFPEGDGKNTIEAMKQLADKDTAAFIFEPLVQGAAGMRMYDEKILDELIKIVRDQGGLAIADEVMTGFGRTGKTFACDHLKNKPDIFCLSKGITGGFLPMGVTAVNERIVSEFDSADKLKAFFHGHSYTANPIACAAANASMKLLMEKKTQQNIQRITDRHAYFVKTTPVPAHVSSIRSKGTILAITMKADDPGYTSTIKDQIYGYFLERDILLRPLGNVIYMIPPYIITDEELEKIYSAIADFLSAE